MKILLITDLYPIKTSELTTPRTLLNFVDDWGNMGHEVKVLKPNFLFNSFLRQKPFYKTGLYGNVFNVNYVLPFCGNVTGKTRDFLDDNFDIVIAHMPSGVLFADKTGFPFIAGVHSSDIEILTNPLYKFYFKTRLLRALRNSKAIACRSYVLRKKLLKLYPEFESKTFTAPSGINKTLIIDKPNRLINPKDLKVVTCANFKKRKNIDKLIRALKGVSGVRLMVIGDGKKRCALQKLDRNVCFTGELQNSDVINIMRQNDVFILPSVQETFGMVYLEAMAGGCITICTENDGIDGIIKNGVNGFTTKADVQSIRKVIQKIQSYPAEQLEHIRQNSINTIRQYTREECSKNYLDTIHKFIFK